jgi:predicted PurR-regulated permease PerM
MDKIRSFFDSFASPLLVALFVVLFLLETWRQLRRRTQKRWARVLINVIVSIPAFALLRLLLIPCMVWLAVQNQTWRFGLSYLVELPVWAETIFMFILLGLHELPLAYLKPQNSVALAVPPGTSHRCRPGCYNSPAVSFW